VGCCSPTVSVVMACSIPRPQAAPWWNSSFLGATVVSTCLAWLYSACSTTNPFRRIWYSGPY